MGHEVLVDGCFNADPHPGNILYLAKTEQLGLIDYGQVKLHLACLYLLWLYLLGLIDYGAGQATPTMPVLTMARLTGAH